MGYAIDLTKVSLEDYRRLLMQQDLLPSRKILQENIEANFQAFEKAEVRSVSDLKAALSTPQKINVFSAQTQVPIEYLTILKREIGSLDQKPVMLSHFPGIDPLVVKRLNDAGVATSRDYYRLTKTAGNVQKVADAIGMSSQAADDLKCLSNLVRINGVGALAARTFLEAGYRSITDVAGADAEEMLARVTEVNQHRQYYNARLGVKDIQFCIDFAKTLIRWEEGDQSR